MDGKYVVFENKKDGKLYLGKLMYSTTNHDVVNNIFNSNIVDKNKSYVIDKNDVIDDNAIQDKFPGIKSVFDSIWSLTEEFEEQSTHFKTDFEKLKQDYENAKRVYIDSETSVKRKYSEDVRQKEKELDNKVEMINNTSTVEERRTLIKHSVKDYTFNQNQYVAFMFNGKLCVGKVNFPVSNQLSIESFNKKKTYLIDTDKVEYIKEVQNNDIKTILESLRSITTKKSEEIEKLSIPFRQLESKFKENTEEFAKSNNELSKDYNENLHILESKLEGEIDNVNIIRERKDDPDEINKPFYTNKPRGPDVRGVLSSSKSKKDSSHFNGGKQKSKMKTKKSKMKTKKSKMKTNKKR